jgi:hypothetical protein
MRIAGYGIGQKFERHKTMQARIFRLVDHTHPAATEFLDNPVVRNGFSDHVEKSYVSDCGKSMKAMKSSSLQLGR